MRTTDRALRALAHVTRLEDDPCFLSGHDHMMDTTSLTWLEVWEAGGLAQAISRAAPLSNPSSLAGSIGPITPSWDPSLEEWSAREDTTPELVRWMRRWRVPSRKQNKTKQNWQQWYFGRKDDMTWTNWTWSGRGRWDRAEGNSCFVTGWSGGTSVKRTQEKSPFGAGGFVTQRAELGVGTYTVVWGQWGWDWGLTFKSPLGRE